MYEDFVEEDNKNKKGEVEETAKEDTAKEDTAKEDTAKEDEAWECIRQGLELVTENNHLSI